MNSAELEKKTSRVDITVGIVSLNEENTVGKAVDAFLKDALGRKVEIIVVAGGRDRTIESARNALGDYSLGSLIEDTHPRGKPAALNTIISKARGQILILSDGDVEVENGSISHLLSAFESKNVGCASGRVKGIPAEFNHVETACDMMTDFMHLSRSKDYKVRGTIQLASGYLIALRKEIAPRIPEEVNSDDGYLSMHVLSSGFSIAYVDNAGVKIRYPKTMADFIRQKTRTRYGHIQLRDYFPGQKSRSLLSELREYVCLFRWSHIRTYGAGPILVAVVLTSSVWSLAFVRRILPWLFRRRVWQPVSSTKQA